MRWYSARSCLSLAYLRSNSSSILLTTLRSTSLSSSKRWLLRLSISYNFRSISIRFLRVSCSAEDSLMLLLFSFSILWVSFFWRS